MKCLKCEVQFSPSYIMLMKDDQLPICDACFAEEYHIQVVYDGSQDMFEFLKESAGKYLCNKCLKDSLELVRIKYGNTVKAFVTCPSCHAVDEMKKGNLQNYDLYD